MSSPYRHHLQPQLGRASASRGFGAEPHWATERAACMCIVGESCSSFAPGHALHLIQARLSSATPSEWVDAIIESTDAAHGVLRLRTVARGEAVELWSASSAAHEVSAGTPVALHGRYDVLAVGSLRYNVLRG